jgi:CubicO group peptidase (beta-lactamase class C family)
MSKAPSQSIEIVAPETVGVSSERLGHFVGAIEQDIATELYDGAVVIAGRKGKIFLQKAIGFSDRVASRKMETDAVFSVMSISKTIASSLVLKKVDSGELQLTTRIADIAPEFGRHGKSTITVAHLLGHTGGVPGDGIGAQTRRNLQKTFQLICEMPPVFSPGEFVCYSAFAGQTVLAEIVRRLDGGHRSYTDILKSEIFDPVRMTDTSLGQRPDLESRRVRIVSRERGQSAMPDEVTEAFNEAYAEGAEMPGSGIYSTAYDCFRFAEMLRSGGELEGTRVLSPLILKLACSNYTDERPHTGIGTSRPLGALSRGWPRQIPAYLGLGVHLRGQGIFPVFCGLLASPGTFGHMGRGSTAFWVDPELDMTFVCLTAGLLEETRSIERWQRLSDLVLSSVTKI